MSHKHYNRATQPERKRALSGRKLINIRTSAINSPCGYKRSEEILYIGFLKRFISLTSGKVTNMLFSKKEILIKHSQPIEQGMNKFLLQLIFVVLIFIVAYSSAYMIINANMPNVKSPLEQKPKIIGKVVVIEFVKRNNVLVPGLDAETQKNLYSFIRASNLDEVSTIILVGPPEEILESTDSRSGKKIYSCYREVSIIDKSRSSLIGKHRVFEKPLKNRPASPNQDEHRPCPSATTIASFINRLPMEWQGYNTGKH